MALGVHSLHAAVHARPCLLPLHGTESVQQGIVNLPANSEEVTCIQAILDCCAGAKPIAVTSGSRFTVAVLGMLGIDSLPLPPSGSTRHAWD